MRTYNVKLKIISPVIIHSGEIYDFIRIVPLKDKKVAIINPDRVFASMSMTEQNDFFLKMEKNINEARSVFYNVIQKNPSLIESVCDTTGEFNDEIIKNPKAEINQILKNAISGNAYIPGSSIKGAIRTALLEKKRFQENMEYRKGDKSVNFEAQIIENNPNVSHIVTQDPFKYLKVSDFTVLDSATFFGTARIINKKGESGIPLYTEMTNSLFYANKEIIAKGTITINENMPGKYKQLLSVENILKSVHDFYSTVTKTLNHNNIIGIEDLIKKNFYKDEAIIRLGRFNQIESKTFNIIRENEYYPKRNNYSAPSPLPEDININGGVSRTLINNDVPAGWCIMSVEGVSSNTPADISFEVNITSHKPVSNTQVIRSTPIRENSRLYKDGEIVEIKITSVGNPFSNAETTDKHVKGSIPIKELANRFISDPNEIIKVGDIKKAIVSYRIDNNGREHLNFSLKGYEKQKINQYMV